MSFRQEYLTRQADLIPMENLGLSITIIGCGAIGSFTALSLAKMGFLNLTVYDMDDISMENMNCQFFPETSLGRNKAEVMAEQIAQYVGANIRFHPEKVTKDTNIMSDIVISAVDNMETRKLVHEISASKYLIDPRMAAEYATLEVVDKGSIDRVDNYVKTLYTDKEAVAERCTAKSTVYTTLLIAGQIAKVVKDIATGNPYLRTFDWNIKENRITAFDCNGKPL